MSTFGRTRTTLVYDALYCAGVVMTLACFAFVLAGNTEALWQLEHTRIPMSWVFGGVAVFVVSRRGDLPSAVAGFKRGRRGVFYVSRMRSDRVLIEKQKFGVSLSERSIRCG